MERWWTTVKSDGWRVASGGWREGAGAEDANDQLASRVGRVVESVPGGSGRDSKTCDSLVSGMRTPELFAGVGKSVLIRLCTLAAPWGAES